MLKKLILFTLVLMLVLSVTACTNADNGYEVNSNWDEYTPMPIVPLTEDMERRIFESLVVYHEWDDETTAIIVDWSIPIEYVNTYGNGIAFVDLSKGCPIMRPNRFSVSGYDFAILGGYQLLFYTFESSIILELETTYETGLISREELRDMVWHFRSEQFVN